MSWENRNTSWSMLGAGDRDRTGMASLEGWGSTIELHPRTARRGWNPAPSSSDGPADHHRPSPIRLEGSARPIPRLERRRSLPQPGPAGRPHVGTSPPG